MDYYQVQMVLGMMDMLPGILGAMVLIYALFLVFIGIGLAFLTVYKAEETRAIRTGEREDDLGAKVLGGMLACLCILITVFGLSLLLGSFTMDEPFSKMFQKMGLGFVAGGVVAGIFPFMILKHTGAVTKVNGKLDFSSPIASKTRGICAAVTGIMASIAVTFLVMNVIFGGSLGFLAMTTVAYGGSFYLFAMPWLPFGKGGAAAAPPQAGAPGPPPSAGGPPPSVGGPPPSVGGPPPRAGGPPPPAG